MPLSLGIVPRLAIVKGFKIHFFSGWKMSCCHDVLIPWQMTNVYTGGGGRSFLCVSGKIVFFLVKNVVLAKKVKAVNKSLN